MWYSATLYSLCKCINSHLFFAKLPGSSAVRKAAKRHTAHDKNAREFSIRRATPGWWMNCHVKQKTDIFLSCTSWNAKPERWESGCNLNLHNWILLDYKERLVDWRWEKKWSSTFVMQTTILLRAEPDIKPKVGKQSCVRVESLNFLLVSTKVFCAIIKDLRHNTVPPMGK